MHTDEEDEDLRNIIILEVEGHWEVEVLKIDNPNIIVPLKKKQVNISAEAEPKFAKMRGYWDDTTMNKVVDLLHKYIYIFSL